VARADGLVPSAVLLKSGCGAEFGAPLDAVLLGSCDATCVVSSDPSTAYGGCGASTRSSRDAVAEPFWGPGEDAGCSDPAAAEAGCVVFSKSQLQRWGRKARFGAVVRGSLGVLACCSSLAACLGRAAYSGVTRAGGRPGFGHDRPGTGGADAV